MFLLKLLFCLFVLCCSEIIFGFAERRCSDCISIAWCNAGLDFARRIRQGTLPSNSIQTFRNAVCGRDPRNPKIPKVCCSDFPMNEPTQRTLERRIEIDSIDNHRNIGLLPTSYCGDIDGSRIVGGSVAKLYELPWMTLISYRTSDGLDFKCAGSVINSRYILTAAHCVIHNGQRRTIAGVRIGDFDYRKNYDCQGQFENMICESEYQDIEVEQIIPHESYTGGILVENDIALLRLKETINMTRNAAPICLPVYSELRNAQLSGKNGTVAGWGAMETGSTSSELMKAVIPILSGNACSHYYNRAKRTSILQKVFCAGVKGKDTCDGDSGGPLMVESDFNGSIRMVQFGVVSFGPKQCGSAYPGVYTDLTKYMGWILDNIRA